MRTRQRDYAMATLKMLQQQPSYDPHDDHSNIVDALTGLIHLASFMGSDIADAWQTALMHARAEVQADLHDAPADDLGDDEGDGSWEAWASLNGWTPDNEYSAEGYCQKEHLGPPPKEPSA